MGPSHMFAPSTVLQLQLQLQLPSANLGFVSTAKAWSMAWRKPPRLQRLVA